MRRAGVLVLAVVMACSVRTKPPAVSHAEPRSAPQSGQVTSSDECSQLERRYATAKPLRTLTGKATYYSNSLEGHKMASGEVYQPDGAQAAHRTLPFGTLVRVTMVDSKRSVIVRIADRGPYGKGRIIDVSYAAAERLGLIRAGVAMVRIDVLQMP